MYPDTAEPGFFALVPTRRALTFGEQEPSCMQAQCNSQSEPISTDTVSEEGSPVARGAAPVPEQPLPDSAAPARTATQIWPRPQLFNRMICRPASQESPACMPHQPSRPQPVSAIGRRLRGSATSRHERCLAHSLFCHPAQLPVSCRPSG